MRALNHPGNLLAVVGLTAVAACHPIPNDTGAALTATGQLVALSGGDGGAANACFSCHGMEGQGDGIAAPRLAGLDVGYLQKQMEDYASGVRADDVMGPVARGLSQSDRRAVAAWYASLPPPAATAAALPMPVVYLSGDASRGVQPCAVCHGDQGQGAGPGGPAISGQPRAYTVEQIDRWRSGGRRNDPRGVMRAAVANLSAAEIQAIAAWLETSPASRPPGSGAATSSVAAAIAERPAASSAVRRPDR